MQNKQIKTKANSVLTCRSAVGDVLVSLEHLSVVLEFPGFVGCLDFVFDLPKGLVKHLGEL